jgi:hypothetical protein
MGKASGGKKLENNNYLMLIASNAVYLKKVSKNTKLITNILLGW